MGLLDFLFPVLMAAETRSKIKSEKEWKRERELQNKLHEERTKSLDYYKNLYTDRYYELEKIPKMIKRSHYDVMCMEDREFVFSDILEDCPSFDPERKSDNEDLTRCFFQSLGKMIALAKYYGKVPFNTFSTNYYCSYQVMWGLDKEWWGRREYNYEGQMFHELMQMWYQYLKEYDFPFELRVIDTVECPQDRPIRMEEGIPIMCIENYKGGYLYYWDIPAQWQNWVYYGEFTNYTSRL